MAGPEEGKVIAGRYRLDRALARGGMGCVWVGHHLQLDVGVAIKVMAPEYAASAEARARFEREAKAAAQLRIPNVVQIYDFGVEDDAPFLVMELLDGEDLEARIDREGRLAIATTKVVLDQVCRALRRAHEAGVIHRDLKPANVFLARQGAEEIVKILDFGIAKATGQAAGAGATRTGALLGSPHYMSPEQIRNTSKVDLRTDLWAVGVIAFRCLTGQLPFPGDEVGEVLVDVCTAPIPIASQIAPDLGPEVDRFFERALARDLALRFQSAAELAEGFAALASSGAPALATAEVEAPAAPVRAAPETDLTLAKSEAIAATNQADLPSSATPPRPSRRRAAAVISLALVVLAVAGIGVARFLRAPASPSAVSTVPAAQEEYASGIDAYRHRSLAQAIRHFERALELDPTLVAAHARLATAHLNPIYVTGTLLPEAGRRHFAEARRGQDRLSPRDRAYLLAHEPLARATPVRSAFLAATLELASAYPHDAEIVFLLSTAQRAVEMLDEADASAARAVALDPAFGVAYRDLCRHRSAGDPDDALACYARCLEKAPASGPCHDGRTNLLTNLGRCAELAEEGRSWDAVDPEHWGPLLRVTDAMFAQGKPVEAVRDTLGRALAKYPAGTPRVTFLGANMLAIEGDFDGSLRELSRYVEGDVGAAGRVSATEVAADVLEESGRAAEARARIEAASRGSAAWTPIEQTGFAHLELRAAHMDWLAGKLPRADFVRAREALAARIRKEVSEGPWPWTWHASLHAVPLPLAREDARDLLDAAAQAKPGDIDAGLLGEAHLRAGDAAGARPLLETALRPCAKLESAIRTLHLRALLGEALEQTGDVAGAKREYERVLTYWGAARPRSATADAVRARLKALGP